MANTQSEIKEIEEVSSNSDGSTGDPNPRTVRTKVPETEIRVYRQGKGPIDVFKTSLGGWNQDQLEVRDILHEYGFKSLFAFSPGQGRGAPIRFDPKNGRSLLTYKDGSVIYVDGEPELQDSLINPITKIVLGVAIITVLIALVSKRTPEWLTRSNIFAGNFPLWIIACVVIVFTRMQKRTKDLLKKFGW